MKKYCVWLMSGFLISGSLIEPAIAASAQAKPQPQSRTVVQTFSYQEPLFLYENSYVGQFLPFKPEQLVEKAKEAQDGEGRTAFILGYMYETGQNVKLRDFDKARRWYEIAAENGYKKARVALGWLHLRGSLAEGYAPNPFEARKWFERAADEDNMHEAWYELGVMYEKGLGIKRDIDKAFKHYRISSLLGNIDSNVKLGLFYQYGNHVEQDLPQALKYYLAAVQMAEKKNDKKIREEVKGLLGILFLDMAANEQDEKKRMKWYLLSAENENPEAAIIVADAYANAWSGLEEDFFEAIKWYEVAAKKRYTHAMIQMALIYLNGLGDVDRDYEKAYEWYKKAAEAGDAEGAKGLGLIYHNGLGVKRDPDESVKWYKRAAGMEAGDIKVGL